MQKTLTLYPKYITDGSNFGGILSANGTGEDYRTLYLNKGHHTKKDKLHVGTIAFDTSPLWNKSKACLLNGFSISYDQKADPDYGSGAGAVYTCVGKLIDRYNINGTALVVNSMSDFGTSAWQWSTETDDSWHGKTCTFLSGSDNTVIGFEKHLGFDLTMALRSPVVAKEEAYMRNLQASVTYTARYYAQLYSENGAKLLEEKIVDGENAPVFSSAALSACQKEGYKIVGWYAYQYGAEAKICSTFPTSVDTDVSFYPVYERIYFRISLPYQSGSEKIWNVYTYNETTQKFELEHFQFLNGSDGRIYVDIEYGKKVAIYASGWNADNSEDIVVFFDDDNVGEMFDGSETQHILVYETEKLVNDVYVRLVNSWQISKDITTSCNEGGEITPSFSNPRSYSYEVAVTPHFGFEISKITKNGTEIAITNKAGMVISGKSDTDVSFVATFSRIQIPITFEHSDNVTVTGETTIYFGDTGNWVITAKDGYSIDQITIGEEVIANAFKKLDSFELSRYCTEPLTVVITDTNNLVTVTAQKCENGEIVGDLGTYIKGKGVLSIEAKPNPGYRFSAWSGIEQSTQSFTLDTESAEDSYTLGATFEAYAYAVSVEIVGNGQVQQSADYVNYDESVTLKAVPDKGWHFVSWSVEREGANGLSALTDEEFTIENIRSNVSIVAIFAISQFSLETNVSSPDGAVGGTISGNNKDKYDFGTKLTLEAVPSDGYYFVKWSDEVFVPKREYVIPAQNTSLTAYFIRYEYKVTAEGEKGKIELTTEGKTTENEATIRHGENLLVLVTPDFGYRVADVLLDGVSIKNDLTTTRRNTRYLLQNVSANHEITVLFEAKMYTNGRKLIDYYPPVIAAIKDMQEIVKGQQPLIDELWDAVSFVTENQFIDTATEEGVEQWEEELGIVPSSLDTLAQRKKRLKNKWVPDNRFTMIWLYEWLKQVSERNDIKKPTVKDYVLTVTLPAIVDYLSIFSDLEMYKPANIAVSAVISLTDGEHEIKAGIGIKSNLKFTLESEVETVENQTD